MKAAALIPMLLSRCPDVQLFQPLANSSWKRYPTLVIPSGLRISYALHQLTATYAAFFEASRTRFADAAKL